VATAHPALEGAAIQEILWETWSRGDRPANQGEKAEGDEAVGRDFVKENIENYTGKVETAGKPRQETSRNLSELPGKETAVEEDLLAVEEGLPAVGEDLSVPAKTPFMFFQQQTLVEIGRQNPDLTVQQRDELKESLKKKWTGIPDNARSQFIALAQVMYCQRSVHNGFFKVILRSRRRSYMPRRRCGCRTALSTTSTWRRRSARNRLRRPGPR
jgi:hypothetical protein